MNMRRKNFIRVFTSTFLTIAIPLLLCFGIFFYLQLQEKRNEIHNNAADASASLSKNYESVMNNVQQQYDILTGNPRLTISLRNYLKHEKVDYINVILTNNILTNFLALKNNAPYVASVYYYLDGNNYILTSDSGSIVSLDHYDDTDWLPIYSSSSLNSWMVPRNMKQFSYATPVPVVSVFHRLSMFNGVIVINLYTDQLRELFTSMAKSGRFFILSPDGNLVLSSSVADDAVFEQNKDLLLTEVQKNRGVKNTFWAKLNGESFYMESVQSDDGSYLITCLRKASYYRVIYQLILQFIVLFLAIVLISALIAYRITQKNFRQIDHFITVFSNAEKGIYETSRPEFVKDEYEIVLNNIVDLFVNQTFLKNQLSLKENQQKIAEITALQMQINPHFLFNTLQTLNFKSLEYTKKPTDLNKIIESLSDILKYSLENPNSMVTVKDEITYLKKYDNIQRLRYADKYILYFEYDDECLSVPMMRLILQPLIENSLYHAIKPLAGSGLIKLKIQKRDGSLFVAVLDNGIGIGPEDLARLRESIQIPNYKSIGLTNVNSRLIMHYGPDSGLKIMSKLGWGTCVSFHIPV